MMNERIKECWLKAAREDSGEKWDSQEEFIERFAQLIVRECMEIAYEYDAPKMSGPGMIIAGRIEDRFGVES
jgi:hypothetical protein